MANPQRRDHSEGPGCNCASADSEDHPEGRCAGYRESHIRTFQRIVGLAEKYEGRIGWNQDSLSVYADVGTFRYFQPGTGYPAWHFASGTVEARGATPEAVIADVCVKLREVNEKGQQIINTLQGELPTLWDSAKGGQACQE